MPYDQNDFLSLLYDFAKTEDGKAIIAEGASAKINNGLAYSRTQMKEIADKLKNDLISAFLEMVKDPSAVFDYGDVKISPTHLKDEQWTISIVFGDKALWRPSLFNPRTWKQTGKGVADIFELFTHGVNYPSYVYGVWMRPDGAGDLTDAPNGGIVKSCRKRVANDFVNKVIAKYQAMYPNINFRWPAEWGGNT